MADEPPAKRHKALADSLVRYYDNITADGHTHQHNGDQIFQGTVYMGSSDGRTMLRKEIEERLQSLLDSLSFEQMDARSLTIETSVRAYFFLWLRGKAGAGKSTLMRYIQDEHLQNKNENEHVFSYFFHARGEDLEKSQVGMFRSLIHQMLQQEPWRLAALDPRRTAQSRQGWNINSLQDFFRALVLKTASGPLTYYIDALDECPEHEVIDMLKYFENLCDDCVEKSRGVSICLSSRHYPGVDIKYRESLTLEKQAGHADDITKYIERHLEIPSRKVKNELAGQMKQKAQGVFFWVVLVIPLLLKAYREGPIPHVREVPRKMPHELTELLKEIMIRGSTSRYLVPLLQWLLFSSRPLKRAELYYAVRSTESSPIGDVDCEDIVDTQMMNSFILEASKGLVEFTKGKQARAQFIHESVRTYFAVEGLASQLNIRDPTKLMGCSHAQLSRCCENYLMTHVQPRFHAPATPPKARSTEGRALLRKTVSDFSFMEYAVQGVLVHADKAQASGEPQSLFVQKFDFDTRASMSNSIEERNYRQFSQTASTAYMLAMNGCSDLLGFGFAGGV
ncbi:hypothetical protein LTR95_011109 [Oleoguttula sp. CCFEE 5521]